MKRYARFSCLMALMTLTLVAASCGGSDEPNTSTRRVVPTPEPQVVVVEVKTAADGLDPKALGELASRVKNARELESELNRKGGINNLDMDDNDVVDTIKVTEFGSGNSRGLSITTDLGKGEDGKENVQEVAVIQMDKTGDTVELHVIGNEQIYGSYEQAHYHSGFTMTDFMLMQWAMSPHQPYVNNTYVYPSYPPVSRQEYVTRTTEYTRSSRIQRATPTTPKLRTTIQSPNRDKVASSKIKAPLKNPTPAQTAYERKFPARDTIKAQRAEAQRTEAARKAQIAQGGNTAKTTPTTKGAQPAGQQKPQQTTAPAQPKQAPATAPQKVSPPAPSRTVAPSRPTTVRRKG